MGKALFLVSSLIFCLTVAVSSFVHQKAVRNDDVTLESLMTLVQQQAATIQTLQSRLDVVEYEQTALQATDQQLKAENQQQTTQINTLNAKAAEKGAYISVLSIVHTIHNYARTHTHAHTIYTSGGWGRVKDFFP
jgi:septal ring factor EnvC (AmiA/AmiB activator)